ncbi:hypothetical protein B0H21DRAFT_785958 [Amylocystis lapponica]|nr:hypothetical protein B0H21DRAFT_785958 [Amylocystis lapponica]
MFSRHFTPFKLPALIFIPSAAAFKRSIGAKDPRIKLGVDICFSGGDPNFSNLTLGYEGGACPNLINCVMDNLAAADQAGLSAGASIAAMLPTILALTGSSPVELIQLGLTSPLRAVATCMFGIGLPSRLFGQLRTHSEQGGSALSDDGEWVQVWNLPIPRNVSAAQVALRLAVDFAVAMLAGFMLWRNYVVCSITMVTFRCEYSWLLLAWPAACLMWLVMGMGGLHALSEDIDTDIDGEPVAWYTIPRLPYIYRKSELGNAERKYLVEEDGDGRPDIPTEYERTFEPNRRPASRMEGGHGQEIGVREGRMSLLTVRIRTRHPAMWGWYEATLETIAVGIYLYATIVLGSILFLTGQQGIEYTVSMVLSLSAIRIVVLIA